MSRDLHLLGQGGDVLFYVSLHPGSTAYEIQEALQINLRRLYVLLVQMKQAKLLMRRRRRKCGQVGFPTYHFYANLDVPFSHPALSAPSTFRMVLASVALEHEVLV